MAADTPIPLRVGLVDGDPPADVGPGRRPAVDLPEGTELITQLVADTVAILRRVNCLAVDEAAT